MDNETIFLSVNWSPIRFSQYLRGVVTSDTTMMLTHMAVGRIYKHGKSGQIRIYSGMNLNGLLVEVNGEPPKRMRARGRFGRLYISE